jgi:hypothetical protein
VTPGRDATRIRDFQLVHGPKSLPIRFESLYVAALGDRLCVVGLDETRHVQSLRGDSRGDAVGVAMPLPFIEVTGIASCAGNLVVAGVTPSNRADVLRVALDGEVEWHGELPPGQFQQWPRPFSVADVAWLLSITRLPTAAMHLIELTGEGFGISRSLAFADDTDGIDLLGESTSVLLARVHGDGRRLELVRIASGQIISRIEVEAARPVAPSLSRVNDRIALAWVTEPGEPRLQWFDAELEPLAPSEVLRVPIQQGVVRRVQLMATDNELAVLLHSESVVGDAEVVHQPDGTIVRHEPRRTLRLSLAAYDSEAYRLGPCTLVDADSKVWAACWMGSKLVVVHRGCETLLSAFELHERNVSECPA